jgi:hypothetical protein
MTKKKTTATDAKRWHKRADALFNASVADDDSRGALQSITVGLKALELSAEKEKEQAAEAKLPSDGQQSPQEFFDEILRHHDAAETDESRFLRYLGWALESAYSYSGDPEILGHFEQVLRLCNSELLGEYLDYQQRRIKAGDRNDLLQP